MWLLMPEVGLWMDLRWSGLRQRRHVHYPYYRQSCNVARRQPTRPSHCLLVWAASATPRRMHEVAAGRAGGGWV